LGLDGDIQCFSQKLDVFYKSSVRLLKAYIKEFKRFFEFQMMDVSDFIESKKKLSGKELKEEIDRQLQFLEELNLNMPASVVIGPFEVRVKRICKELIVK
jgi:hypothetical protein